MQAFRIILAVLDILIAIALVVLVMSQEGSSQGLGSIAGGSTDTFFGRQQGHSKERVLRRVTTWLAIAFAVVTVVLFILVELA